MAAERAGGGEGRADRFRRWLQRPPVLAGVGLVLYALAHRDAGPDGLLAALAGLRLEPLGAAVVAATAVLLVRAALWWILANGRLEDPARPVGVRESVRQVLAQRAVRALDPSGRSYGRQASWIAGRVDPPEAVSLVTLSEAGENLGLGLVALAGAALAAAAGSLTGWAFWTVVVAALVLGVAMTGYARSLAQILAARGPRSDSPVDESAWLVSSALARQGPGPWIGATVAGVAVALLQAVVYRQLLLALGVGAPFAVVAAGALAATLAGKLSFTLFGLGTRDFVLVWSLPGWAAPPALATLGLLAALRTVLEALAGVTPLRRVERG